MKKLLALSLCLGLGACVLVGCTKTPNEEPAPVNEPVVEQENGDNAEAPVNENTDNAEVPVVDEDNADNAETPAAE